MARYPRPNLNYDASTVWAAAALAQRINGAYIKTIETDEKGQPKVPGQQINRDLMKEAISAPALITDADRAAGEAARTYYKGLTFKILQGKTLSEFDTAAMTIANREVINSMYDIAVIAALPSCYERAAARDQKNRKIEQARGGFLGKVGDKVTATLEVLRSSYSQNYGVYFVTGITEDDKAVFFAYKASIPVGSKVTVKGGVKAHRDNSTQLNRVKVL